MRTIVAVLLALGASRSSGAQPALQLTLDEAIRRGLDASHRLAEAAARADAASAVVDQRHAGALPQLSAQAGYLRTNHVLPFAVPLADSPARIVIYPDVPDNYRTRLDLQWSIYSGGKVDALERAARAEAGASVNDVVTARSDLRLEITRAYWALVTATESQRVVGEALNRMGAHLQNVRNQLDVGLVPPNDVLSVEAQESRQRMLAVQARVARDVSEAELARLIGAPGERIEAVAPLEAPERSTVPLAGARRRGAAAPSRARCPGEANRCHGGAPPCCGRRDETSRCSRRRCRLRKPEPSDLSADRSVAAVVGRGRERRVAAVRWRPGPGRNCRGRGLSSRVAVATCRIRQRACGRSAAAHARARGESSLHRRRQ